jgi:predicted DCC family thiol-disulfide oxidoreductase YuxK
MSDMAVADNPRLAVPGESAEGSRFAGMQGRLLVVYDGECGFCNWSIRWLLRRDGKDRLRFVPSSNPDIAGLLADHGVPPVVPGPDADVGSGVGPDTILVFRSIGTPVEELLVRSNAVLACLRVLPQPWPLFAAMARLIPRRFRESAYRLVGRSRYRIAGRYASCPIPTAEERGHFL